VPYSGLQTSLLERSRGKIPKPCQVPRPTNRLDFSFADKEARLVLGQRDLPQPTINGAGWYQKNLVVVFKFERFACFQA
jgi:hypothetical protein